MSINLFIYGLIHNKLSAPTALEATMDLLLFNCTLPSFKAKG